MGTWGWRARPLPALALCSSALLCSTMTMTMTTVLEMPSRSARPHLSHGRRLPLKDKTDRMEKQKQLDSSTWKGISHVFVRLIRPFIEFVDLEYLPSITGLIWFSFSFSFRFHGFTLSQSYQSVARVIVIVIIIAIQGSLHFVSFRAPVPFNSPSRSSLTFGVVSGVVFVKRSSSAAMENSVRLSPSSAPVFQNPES